MKTGDKISHWEILEYIGKNKHGLNLWRCRCNCSAERVLTTSYLNMQKDRGYRFCRKCHGKEEDKEFIAEYIGKKIGTWTVLALKGRNKYRTRKWLCKCDCGVEKLFTTCYLSGRYKRKATTCKYCELKNLELENRTTDYLPQRFWQKFLNVARKRNIAVLITKEQAFNKYKTQDGRCNLSGLPLYFTKLTGRYWRYTNASIDRIDSTKPYTLDNIQWLEKRINMMKQAYSQHEFVALCKLVAKTDKVHFNEVQWDGEDPQLLRDIEKHTTQENMICLNCGQNEAIFHPRLCSDCCDLLQAMNRCYNEQKRKEIGKTDPQTERPDGESAIQTKKNKDQKA